MWDAMLSVLPEQLSNAKQVAVLKVGRTGPQEADERFPGDMGGGLLKGGFQWDPSS